MLARPKTSSIHDAVFVAGFGLMIVALTLLLLTLLAWRPTIEPAIALTLLAAAFGVRLMRSYRVVIDTTMMINARQTDPREVRPAEPAAARHRAAARRPAASGVVTRAGARRGPAASWLKQQEARHDTALLFLSDHGESLG